MNSKTFFIVMNLIYGLIMNIVQMTKIKELICCLTTIIVLTVSSANADYIRGSFFVSENSHEFTKSIPSGKCSGKITYPVLYNDEEEIIDALNDEIHDFIHSYAICNQGKRSNFSVRFDFPESGSLDYFSIRWITKKDNKIYRIDSLNFDVQNADLIKTNEIFNSMSGSVFKEIIKLSEGHLQPNDDWEMFLDKISKRDVQYYIKNEEWYLVFNATRALNKVVDIKIPQYFLEGDDVTNSR